MRVAISCKKCGLNFDANGRRSCGVCGSHHVYQPAQRVRKIDCRRYTRVFHWSKDDRGPDIIHVDDAEKLWQERGIWVLVQADWLEFPKVDHRETGKRLMAWERRGTRFED